MKQLWNNGRCVVSEHYKTEISTPHEIKDVMLVLIICWNRLSVESCNGISYCWCAFVHGSMPPKNASAIFCWLLCFQVVHLLVLFGTLKWGHNLLLWVCQVADQETSPWSASRAWLGTRGWALKNSSRDQGVLKKIPGQNENNRRWRW